MLYKRECINNWADLIKEGNIIKIRQWKDMVEEYGLLFKDTINCKCRFIDFMEDICGKEFIITKEMEKDYKEYEYFFIDITPHAISTDMIESIRGGYV